MKYCEVLHQNLHMQGFTSDGENMYWSFTDSLVKTTMSGTMLNQIRIPAGHLGDIDYYNGKIYGTVLGNSLKGLPFGVWTAFDINVYDADTLSLVKTIRLDDCFGMYERREHGFNGIDGITVIPETKASPAKIMVATALFDGEEYDSQVILEYSLRGELLDKHYIKTGNTIFGIQNLDRDPETGIFWFSTYGGDRYPYQNKNFLFCASPDFELLGEYNFCTPYGVHCLGNNKFYVSVQGGVNGNRSGYAYEVDLDYIKNTEIGGDDHRVHKIAPLFDEEIGL